MIITVKNELTEFKVYPSASVFVQFKKETGKSYEMAITDPDSDQMELVSKLIHLGHLSYCRIKNENPVVTQQDIMDFITIGEITDIIQKFIGNDSVNQKKTK